ncbi:MAG TPA: AAA family ATPase [Bradyrhizobium sp.]|nr:AAA family ATPase [Bradyrhizobium sp.]
MSVLQLRAFFGREWRLILLATVLSILLGVAYVASSPSRYTALTDMIIDTKRITWVQSEMSSESRGTDDAAVESEIETTKSEKVAGAVVKRLHLTSDPEFVGSGPGLKQRVVEFFRSWLARLPGLEDLAETNDKPSQDELVQRAIDTLESNLRVIRLGRSYHEQISYTSLDPVKAAKIANAFADAYIDDQLDAKFEATRRASDWLQQRLGELRQQATDAYKAVQDFKSANNIIIGADGKLTSEVELNQLGIALAKARADTSEARAKLDRIERVLQERTALGPRNFNIPDPVVTDALSSPVITKLRQQFLEDQNKVGEWSAKYGANHMAVQNLRSDMATIQQSIWDEISRIAESYKSEYQIAKSQEEAIQQHMTDVFNQSAATRQAQVRLRELETAATSYRNSYETFLSRFTQTVQQQSFPSTEARIVTDATPPRKPSSPKVGLTLGLAAVCGLAFGIMCGIAREQMDRQIHTREQLEKLLGTTCLAVLPAMSKKALAGKLRPGQEGVAFRQISEVAPFSATAEALRYIKVAIDLHPSEGKVIGMVSALPGEGKTTVAAAFAAFVSRTGARALLVDADLRNPSMTRSLVYTLSPGLLDMVVEGADFEEFIISDPHFKFDFLPASTQIEFSNSSDVLNSRAVKEMLRKARSTYDYVLVDLPPILPVVDVKASAQLFDAFVMVVEWGSTSTDEILKAIGSTPVLSDRLLGAVLNKADEAVMRRFEGYSSDRRHTYYTKPRTFA